MKSLADITSVFTDYLSEQLFNREPKTLYKPFYYILNLGGKRLRPTLLLAANQLFAGKIEDALPAAMSIELFHNFTLIHDDIMDVADLRRGKPTVHKQFDTNTAILSGDVMMVYAYQYLLKSKHSQHSIDLFNETAILVCEGQQLDMDFEMRDDVSVEEYIRMIELKTAVLIAASLQIGAITAGANEANQTLSYEFGRNLGISFQILDDILDAFPPSKDFGKKIGGDIVQNKKTYLLLKTAEFATSNQQEQLNQLLLENNESIKIAGVRQLMQETGALENAREKASFYYRKALNHLDEMDTNSPMKDILNTFAEELLSRQI